MNRFIKQPPAAEPLELGASKLSLRKCWGNSWGQAGPLAAVLSLAPTAATTVTLANAQEVYRGRSFQLLFIY